MQLDRVSRLAYQSRCGATTLSRSLSGAYPARICVHATAAAAGVFADIVHAHTATELLWWHEPVSLAGRGMALQPPLQEHRRGQQKEQQQHKCHTPIAALLLRQGQGRLSYRQPFSTAALVSAPPEWRQWCKHSLRRRISVSARKFTTVPNKQAASGTISAPSSRLATSDTAENYYAAIKASGSAGQWERALSLLDEMWINGPSTLPPNSETYGEAIAACGSAGQWRQAVDLLQQMAGKGVAADDRCYREAIKACGDGEQWVRAVGLYNRMRMIGVAPGILSHNAIITALGKAGRLKEALAILKRMQQHQAQGRPDIAPDVGTYNAVIFACEEGGHWEQAFSLLEEMKTIGVRPNEESFCHVITACGKGKQWEQAVAMFRKMEKHGVALGPKAYSAIIVAGRNSVQARETLTLFREMQKKGIEPDHESGASVHNAVIAACVRGGLRKEALATFGEMTTPDVASYNAAISALLSRRNSKIPKQALETKHVPGRE